MIHRKALLFLCLTGLAAPLLGGCWQDDAKTNGDLPTYFYITQYSENSAGTVAADTLTMHAGLQMAL